MNRRHADLCHYSDYFIKYNNFSLFNLRFLDKTPVNTPKRIIVDAETLEQMAPKT